MRTMRKVGRDEEASATIKEDRNLRPGFLHTEDARSSETIRENVIVCDHCRMK